MRVNATLDGHCGATVGEGDCQRDDFGAVVLTQRSTIDETIHHVLSRGMMDVDVAYKQPRRGDTTALPALSQPFRTFAVDTDAVSLLHDQPSIGRDSEVSVSLKLLSTPQIVGVSLVSLAIGLGISLLAWWVCWQRCGRQKSGESEPLKPRLPT